MPDSPGFAQVLARWLVAHTRPPANPGGGVTVRIQINRELLIRPILELFELLKMPSETTDRAPSGTARPAVAPAVEPPAAPVPATTRPDDLYERIQERAAMLELD